MNGSEFGRIRPVAFCRVSLCYTGVSLDTLKNPKKTYGPDSKRVALYSVMIIASDYN
jgi:hypothetical protein